MVYEGAQKLAEIGAGIGLFSRPWELLRKLGLEEELLKYTETRPTDGPGKRATLLDEHGLGANFNHSVDLQLS